MKIRKIIAIAGVSLICLTPILLAASVDPECYAKAVAVAKATGSEEAGLAEYIDCMMLKELA